MDEIVFTHQASYQFKENSVLVGEINFLRWRPEFRIAASAAGVYELFTGNEPVLAKPRVDEYTLTSTTPEKDKVDFNSDKFGSAMYEYHAQQKRLSVARDLLTRMVDPAIMPEIRDIEHPKEVFARLATLYRIECTRGIFYAEEAICKLRSNRCGSIVDYIDKLSLLRQDIQELGGDFPEARIVAIILCSLPPAYAGLVARLRRGLRDRNAGIPSVDGIRREVRANEMAEELLSRASVKRERDEDD